MKINVSDAANSIDIDVVNTEHSSTLIMPPVLAAGACSEALVSKVLREKRVERHEIDFESHSAVSAHWSASVGH